MLIDFGKSVLLEPEHDYDDVLLVEATAKVLSDHEVYCHGFLSPWSSMKKPLSYRDDIYRAFQLIATMIFGKVHATAQTDLCDLDTPEAYREYMHLKLRENLFNLRIGEREFRLIDVLRGTTFENRAGEITARLEHALHRIRTSPVRPSLREMRKMVESIV